MRIIVYNERGYPVERLEDILIPRPASTGTLYIEYEGMGIRVITKLTRTSGKVEDEKILAVRIGHKLYVYGNLPDKLAEKIGLREDGRRMIRV